MRLTDLLHRPRSPRSARHPPYGELSLSEKARDATVANWHLGFTAFGGPPVHFQTVRHPALHARQAMLYADLHVVPQSLRGRLPMDRRTDGEPATTPELRLQSSHASGQYQELFAISQALPGPGSTKMLFCINTIHGGWWMGIFSFLVWSLPGALGMYGLSLGIARIDDSLPGAAYAFLTGLNAATVGIIALAAVQLAEKAITDRLTRIVVFFGATAGLLYTALWYFPILIVVGGLSTLIWDLKFPHRAFALAQRKVRPKRDAEPADVEQPPVEVNAPAQRDKENVQLRRIGSSISQEPREPTRDGSVAPSTNEVQAGVDSRPDPIITWKAGVAVVGGFLATLVAIMILRGVLRSPPRAFSLFANMYLAGTIIFGGGPVVVPLLRDYIVAEGWVSSRDFLLGLAIIQAFPGPNFNFAVYLGSLAVRGTSVHSAVGALLAFIGIFVPGIAVQSGFMGVWGVLRKKRWLTSTLRGVHAAAVGLVSSSVSLRLHIHPRLLPPMLT